MTAKTLTALILLLLVGLSAAQTGDPYWDNWLNYPHGTWVLKEVIRGPNANIVESENGKIVAKSTYTENPVSFTWTPFPDTAADQSIFIIETKMEGEESSLFTNTNTESRSGPNCAFSMHDMSPLAVPRAAWATMAGAKKTTEYKFPSFSKVYMCQNTAQPIGGPEFNEDHMRKESLKAGKYMFNVTLKIWAMGGDDQYTYVYEWRPGAAPKTAKLWGKITDGHGEPMPYIDLTAAYSGKEYTTVADEVGNYEIELDGFDSAKKELVLKTGFTYTRDGTEYLKLYWGAIQITYEKTVSIASDADLRQDIDIGVAGSYPSVEAVIDGAKIKTTGIWVQGLRNAAPIYYHLANAVDFSLTILKADISYKLPVEVRLGYTDETYYQASNSQIYVDNSDLPYASMDRPRNREYHEFGHHLMRSAYGRWPEGDDLAGNENHAGYLNPSTADSFIEGFAEYTSLVIAEYSAEANPTQYPTGWDIEENYKAWERRGRSEERAAAGVLWDLYDNKNDAGDTVSIPLEKMWEILKVRRKDFYEYYKAFKAAYPDKDIDSVFKEHGFFADKNPGNGRWNSLIEPCRDTNKDGNCTGAEVYVDYGMIGNETRMEYDVGETVGRAANYNRGDRSREGTIPDAFIAVPDARVRYYTVRVHYNDPSQGTDREYRTENREGLIYVSPLPEGADATITVSVDSLDYSSAAPYTITSQEYDRSYASSYGVGSFDSHDFQLQPTGRKEDPVDEYGEPRWTTDGGYDAADSQPLGGGGGFQIDSTLLLVGGAGILLLGAGAIGLILLVIIVFLILKRRKKK